MRARGAESKARILSTTRSLMAERGYAATAIGAICAETGLPPTSIYWHFGSKEGLLAQVVEDSATEWISELEDAVPRGHGVTLDRALAALVGSIRRKPEILRLMLMMGLDRSHPDTSVRESVKGVRRHARELLARRIAELLPLDRSEAVETAYENLARFVLVLTDGILLAQEIDGEDEAVDRLVDMMRTSLLAVGSSELQQAATS
ncbi:MAG: TetR/AcrR family transcriptional regulator [Actinobacteria bacterium ATB1]|nr:TetR/AcrR family transcriptional regulator [Actinobacteria bacterium ATB1]